MSNPSELFVSNPYESILSKFVVSIMVKNEEESLEGTLRPFIDNKVTNFFIYDTGSTDNTIEKSRSILKDLNVIIVQEPFVDFCVSRNRCLGHTRKNFPDTIFNLMIDAEWYIHNIQEFFKFCEENINSIHDCFHVPLKMGNMCYTNIRLFKTFGNYTYNGVVHEYVTGNSSPVIPSSFYLVLSRSKKGAEKSNERWYRDLSLLLKEYHNSKPPRETYYLAQTYECLGDVENAIKFYKERSSMTNGFIEERFMAAYNVGVLSEKNNWNTAMEFYLLATSIRPHRIEPLVKISQHYENPQLKYMFAKQACEYPYPSQDLLFIKSELYNYNRWDQLAIGAFYMGKYQEMLDALHKAIPQNPTAVHLYNNMCFCLNSLPDKSPKVLNLILYSEEESFKNMYDVLTEFLRFSGIDHYFYFFDPELEVDYLISDNIIRFKGQETFLPGILDKTLKVFELFKDSDYDYIVRSNISSVINFKILNKWLYYNPMDYGGLYNYTGSLIDFRSGLNLANNAKYGSYPFISGTCIVLSKKFINVIVNNQEEIRQFGIENGSSIIDDVAIGIAFELFGSDLVKGHFHNSLISANDPTIKNNTILYRNKRPDRNLDVINMKLITNGLMEYTKLH